MALQDFYSASSTINRHEFAAFSHNLLTRHPEIRALEWLPRVPKESLKSFEAAVHAEGYADFKVTERTADGGLAPVQARDEYFPITFIEPMQGNERAFGMDSFSNPASKQSKLLARATGKPSI